jgi:retinol dehydrogenase-12
MSQDLAGQTVLITGANTGIGRATAEVLAARGAEIIIATRSEEKTRPVIAAIEAAGGRARFVALDLGDFASIRTCAQALEGTPIHTLVANAGLAGPRGLTASGFELAFGTNHVGHYLFVRLLEANLRAAATPTRPARLVVVSSASHYMARALDWSVVQQPTKSTTGLKEYEVSKLANVLFAKEISLRWGPGVVAVSLHPGTIASDIWRRIPGPVRWVMKRFMKSVEEGALTSIHCATTPTLVPGAYYSDSKEKAPSRLALDAALATELWRRSAEWTGLPV